MWKYILTFSGKHGSKKIVLDSGMKVAAECISYGDIEC